MASLLGLIPSALPVRLKGFLTGYVTDAYSRRAFGLTPVTASSAPAALRRSPRVGPWRGHS